MAVTATLKFSATAILVNQSVPTNYTTGSFTTDNNSLLSVEINTISDSGTQANFGVSSSPALTWTRQVRAASNGSSNPPASEIWTAPVTTGASTTVTLSCSASGTFAGDGVSSSIAVTSITGHDTVGNPIGLTSSDNQNGSTTGPLSVSMGGTTASSSLTIATLSCDGDHGAALVDGGSGWTELHKAQSGTGGWFRSTTEYIVGAISTYDFGALNDPYQHSSAALEIKAASGGGGAAPFGQPDWPNPVRRPSHHAVQAHIDPSEMWLLAPAAPAVPFFGSTQPNPAPRTRDVSNLGYVDPSEFWLVMPVGQRTFPEVRGASRNVAQAGFVNPSTPPQLLTGDKPFALLNQPNPVLRRGDVSNLGYVDGTEYWLFSAPNPVPFNQTDWPVPKGPAPRLNGGVAKIATPDQLLTGDKPFVQNDWPLPRITTRLNAGFVDAYPNRTVAVTAAPFAQIDWPIPRGKSAAHVGFVSSYAVNFLQPSAQTDWPLPLRRSPLNTGFVAQGLALSIPYSLDAPFAQLDWPVPRGRAPLNTGFVASGLSLIVAPPPPAPFAQDDWPLPGRGRPPLNVGFTVAGLANGMPVSLDLPFKQTDWPVPAGRAWTIRGFVSSGLALTAVDTPFSQSDWQLPVRGAVTVRGSVSSSLALTTPPAPFAQTDWLVPKAAGRAHVGFVSQSDALRFQFLAGKPFAQTDWPNPVRSRIIYVASSLRPSQNVTIRLPVNGYVPRSDGAALLI